MEVPEPATAEEVDPNAMDELAMFLDIIGDQNVPEETNDVVEPETSTISDVARKPEEAKPSKPSDKKTKPKKKLIVNSDSEDDDTGDLNTSLDSPDVFYKGDGDDASLASLPDVSEDAESCISRESDEPERVIEIDSDVEEIPPPAKTKASKIEPKKKNDVKKKKDKKKKKKFSVNNFIDDEVDVASGGESEGAFSEDDDLLLGEEDFALRKRMQKEEEEELKIQASSDEDEEEDVPEGNLNHLGYEVDSFLASEGSVEEDDDEDQMIYHRLNNDKKAFNKTKRKIEKEKKSNKEKTVKERVVERKITKNEQKVTSVKYSAVTKYKAEREGTKTKETTEDGYGYLTEWLQKAPGSEITRVKQYFDGFAKTTVNDAVKFSYGKKMTQMLQSCVGKGGSAIRDMLYSLLSAPKRNEWKNSNGSLAQMFYTPLVSSTAWTQFCLTAQFFDKSNLYSLYANPRERIEFFEKVCPDKKLLLNCFPLLEYHDIFCATRGIYAVKTYTPKNAVLKEKREKNVSAESNAASTLGLAKGENPDKIDLMYLQLLNNKEKATRRNKEQFDGLDTDRMENDVDKLEYLNHLIHTAWQIETFKYTGEQLSKMRLSKAFVCPFSGLPINETEEDCKDGAMAFLLLFVGRKEFVFMTKPEFDIHSSPFLKVVCNLFKKLSLKNKKIEDITPKAYVKFPLPKATPEIKQTPAEETQVPAKRKVSVMMGLEEDEEQPEAKRQKKVSAVYLKGNKRYVDVNSNAAKTVFAILEKYNKTNEIQNAKTKWEAIPDIQDFTDKDITKHSRNFLPLVEDDLDNLYALKSVFGDLFIKTIPSVLSGTAEIVKEYKGFKVTAPNESRVLFFGGFADIVHKRNGGGESLRINYTDPVAFAKKYSQILPILAVVFGYTK